MIRSEAWRPVTSGFVKVTYDRYRVELRSFRANLGEGWLAISGENCVSLIRGEHNLQGVADNSCTEVCYESGSHHRICGDSGLKSLSVSEESNGRPLNNSLLRLARQGLRPVTKTEQDSGSSAPVRFPLKTRQSRHTLPTNQRMHIVCALSLHRLQIHQVAHDWIVIGHAVRPQNVA